MHTHNIQYLLLFYGNSGCVTVLHRYFMYMLHVLLLLVVRE